MKNRSNERLIRFAADRWHVACARNNAQRLIAQYRTAQEATVKGCAAGNVACTRDGDERHALRIT